MPVRIRLQRHGRRHHPFYYVVVADSRAPRDGRFIERIGSYNPMTNPASVQLDFDKALSWLQKGAQPSDTCRSILSREGVMMYNHLLKGVRKGAFDQATADKKFETWKAEKDVKLRDEAEKTTAEKEKEKAERLAKEKEVNEERAKQLAEKNAELNAAAEAEAKGEEEAAEAKEEQAEASEAQAEGEAEVAKEAEAPEAKEDDAKKADDENQKKAEN
ncbi:30S ribosomal protein S16 [Salinivirga cyanobacteriivorans]|uniref:Small ribosomal subunit protein bS16 n=1 Tax=Salinivirga cyanobacteriivorans TaxID=1307839 RepID=A0A0S2I1H3_9BACT|nr:30S ribosomal protein S16 [Salinivirga cyanobacteriivorans]ALO16114.1 30S ribosomal protein S16 [Salinivirga cyanobacteriivorans]